MKEFWDKRYSEPGLAYGSNPNDFLVENFGLIKKAGKVLCIAEGEGRNALFLARQGFRVTAVDFSEIGLRKLKKKALEENLKIEVTVSDLKYFKMGNKEWDAVVSIFAHTPSPLRKEVHKNIQACLVKGGILLLEAYRPQQLGLGTGGPKDVDIMMSLDLLHAELPELTTVLEKETTREILEGKFHHGISAVVQYIGKK